MNKRHCVILFCILWCIWMILPVSAGQTGSAKLVFQYENHPVGQVRFQIYQAAEWDGKTYSFVSPFSGYSVGLTEHPDNEEWETLASTLAAYAARDQLAPLASGMTKTDGTLQFDGLSEGLYLIVGQSTALDGQTVLPQPMLITLSFPETADDTDQVVTAIPKVSVITETGETTTCRVMKIWKDADSGQAHPSEISVQLLCDGLLYEECKLNKACGWSHTWENLDAGHHWQLTEKEVPDNYTVQILQEGDTFTVTNTYSGGISRPQTTGNPGQDDDALPGNRDASVLPQTGMLWWPVPLLLGCGAVTLFIGVYLLLRRKDHTSEQ